MKLIVVALATLSALLLAPTTAADADVPSPDVAQLLDNAVYVAGQAADDPDATVQDPSETLDRLLSDGQEGPPDDEEGGSDDPGFADRVRDLFATRWVAASLASLGVAALGVGGFAFVTRHISPKEALQNPQRSMLYGYVLATPGAHLKQLSERFNLKSSSILWHMRKLEAADLVHTERANGFRVFYATEGGVDAKRVSRAISALQNQNARTLYEAVERRGGATTKGLARRLGLHAGTARWHLRKMRDHGLLEEVVTEGGSRFYATPLGTKALGTLAGTAPDGTPAATPSEAGA